MTNVTFPNPHVITTMFALIEKEGLRMRAVDIFQVVLDERRGSRERRRGRERRDDEGRGGKEQETGEKCVELVKDGSCNRSSAEPSSLFKPY